jgi:hypothetical protein
MGSNGIKHAFCITASNTTESENFPFRVTRFSVYLLSPMMKRINSNKSAQSVANTHGNSAT